MPIGLIGILNIDSKNLKSIHFTGVDGEIIKGVIANIKLSLGDFEFITYVVFAEISGTVGILGQYGFFDKFVVKFDLQKEEIEIKPRV